MAATAQCGELLASRCTPPSCRRFGGSRALMCGDAQPGSGVVRRRREEILTATDSADLEAGDAFEIRTPGGGGFGAP